MNYQPCTSGNTPCEQRRTGSCCLAWITAALAALTLLAAGILIGSAITATVTENLAAFIVLTVVLAVVTLAFLTMALCRKNRCCLGS